MEAVAHYNLLERLGEGGLGDVFRARDTKVGRTVALKLLPPDLLADPAERLLFTQTVRAAMSLSHPSIATLFETGEHEGRSYLVYEFAAGSTLRQDTGGRPVNPRRALELAIQIADGLAEAHARDIVHSDLRPETIMVTAKGRAKILDFGLSAWTRGGVARRAAASSPDTLGDDTARVAPYLSPEQALGQKVDERSDVFSLAVVLYEMLTGRSPFEGASAAATVVNVIGTAPLPPSEVHPGVPSALDATMLRALSKELDRRYQSAAQFGAELRGISTVLDVRSAEREPVELPPLRTNRRSGAVWIVAVLAALAVAVWWLVQR